MTLQEQLEPYKAIYSPLMLENFLDYWEESNQKGKQKWQLEKTWEIGRRLKRWKRQQDQWDYEKSQRNTLKKVEEMPRENRGNRIDEGFTKLFG